jgi:hypothetical protein
MSTHEQFEKRNLRISEFITRYGIGRTKFYIEVAEGRLKVLKCGKITLIPVESAEAWQTSLREGLK